MKLTFKIFILLTFSFIITIPAFAACVDSEGANVINNGKLADKKYCCDNYATYNKDICSEANDISSSEKVKLKNPLGEGTTPQKLIGRIIRGLLGIVGSLALIMFIYGGFLWMTAAGAPDKIEKGKQTLMWATLGMIVIFSSYALVQFVIDAIGA